MNNQGSAIYCENCRYETNETVWLEEQRRLIPTGQKVFLHTILGSISPDGILYIKLYKGGLLTVTQGIVDLKCKCGYSIGVEITSSQINLVDLPYAKN